MKHRNYLKALSALLLLAYCGNVSYAQGSLKALYFPGNGVLTPTPTATTNSFVDLGTALKDSLALSSFTIEMWVKMGATNSVNPVLIGDKDWASGSNTGFILSYYASTDASSGTAPANDMRFNFRAANGTRVDYDIAFPAAIAQHWNHIAITINRSGNIIGYLNGIATGHAYTTGTENISADAAKTLAGTLPVRLGTDGKVNGYRAPFNGTMDEVRIWKSVRTPQELRDNMCHKLTGSESNLLAYYKMDEVSGNGIVNNATATSGSFNGTWVNNISRVNSGAAIGDVSLNVYATDLSDSILNINSSSAGNFSISNIAANMQGLQVYEINGVPANVTGILNPNNKYYGVFPVNNVATYNITYDYSNDTVAVSNNSSTDLYRRGTADSDWVSAGFAKDATSKTFTNSGLSGASEMLLGNFTTNPLALDLIDFNIVKSTDQSKAILTWIVANVEQGASYEIERSRDGVVFLNMGTVSVVTDSKDEKGNDVYHFTDATPLPGNNFYRIKVVKADGGFKYFPVKSIQFNAAENRFSLFPNPFDHQLTLSYVSQINTVITVMVYDLIGKEISRQNIKVTPAVSQYPIDVAGFPNGSFLLSVRDRNSNFQTTIKMIKK
jgi:hypothetical protein